MNKTALKVAISATLLGTTFFTPAFADIDQNNSVVINADSDLKNYDSSAGNGEGIYLQTQDVTRVKISSSLTDINNSLNVDGSTTLNGTTVGGSLNVQGTIYDSTGTLSIGDALDVTGATAMSSTLSVTGNTYIASNLDVDGSSTLGANGNSSSILSSNVSIGTGAYSTVVAVGSTQVGTTVTSRAGAATSSMTNTAINSSIGDSSTVMNGSSIVSTVDIGESSRNGVISVAKDGTQYVADENGKITTTTETETDGEGSEITAAVVVTNDAGNTHGIVVEETKTTISGGINSSSLTLNDLGATFSDPSNGAPIQVHGVADGTADFDATNVRQVYSGLAAVLAATPELRLEPGKTGVGVGLGSYGGFNAVGIGFGHMYDNGAVLTGSVSKAPESEVAYKASVSWTW